MKTLQTFLLSILLLAGINSIQAEVPLDFDGDGRTDAVAVRGDTVAPTSPTLQWYIRRSGDGSLFYTEFGIGFTFAVTTPGDVPTVADFDGDGRTDIAVWRPTNLTYYILNSLDSTVRIEPFGQANDDATAVGDYDGDGRADLGLYRKDGTQPKNNYFIVRKSFNNPTGALTWVRMGSGTGAKRYPGDFDGDGKLDFCVFAGGRFTISRSSDFGSETVLFGVGTDKAVSGDVDGDGRTDFCLVRRSHHDRWAWHILERDGGGTGANPIIWGSTALGISEWPYGGGDYDGDGKSDIAVIGWTNPNNVLRIRRSSDRALLTIPWGLQLDIMVVPTHGDNFF